MLETLFPREQVRRALTFATMAAALANGLFYSVSALYFTLVIGLSATSVGLGLTIAGGVGVAASYAGGALSDRFGPDRVQVVATGLQGLALLAYVFASDMTSFVVTACVAVGARAVLGTAKTTLQARWFVGPERVDVRARLRVVTNVFMGLGTCLAAGALVIDTPGAYQATMVGVGVGNLLAVIPLLGLRGRVVGLAEGLRPTRGRRAGDASRGRSPLMDRTYLASVALNSLLAMQFSIQNIGIPLWIAHHTDAPVVMVSVLMVTNTVLVSLLQIRAARGTHDIRTAGRVVRRGSLLLGAGCLLYAVSGQVGAVLAIVFLVLAELASTFAEISTEAGGWGLAFELADPKSVGAYQGVAATGYSVSAMLGPLVITATAIAHGTAGWFLLGGVFVVAGCLVSLVATRAAAERVSDDVGLTV
ncbi:MAG: MFS transporter [Nocardioides sp.]|nr:MFS transporter [Nocardioides sp.]